MNKNNKAIISHLSEIFSQHKAENSYVGIRLINMIEGAQRIELPSFPRQIQIETTNICNHNCNFCAYITMERPRRHMDPNLFRRLVQEAYDCGAREIGLFAGAEPLTCKWIVDYVYFCREIGYEYMYISTNGSLPNQEKFRQILEAGLSSIKFSVNGGNRETYLEVHGKDHFDRIIDNIKFVSAYRKKVSQKVYLGVSFVGTDKTRHTFQDLIHLLDEYVDEIIYYEASNQSGQMPELPAPTYRDCSLPFNKLHISREGYLKACCNDYENLLALVDLNHTPLKEAWESNIFREFRRKHINNDLGGTLCANCIRGCHEKPKPLNNILTHSGKNIREIVE